MAPPNRTASVSERPAGAGATPSLLDRLEARPWEFDFFQAVWLLERFSAATAGVGQRGPVSQETLRFRPDVSLAFPSTDVRSIARRDPGDGHAPYHRLDVAFMGFYGVSSPLPMHYGVDVLRSVDQSHPHHEQSRASDAADDPYAGEPDGSPLRDFLDIFNHRLISLFYRAWLKYRFDRSFALAGRDAIVGYLRWLIGCPPHYDEAALGVPPLRMVRYAGVLTQHPRSAGTLEGVLSDYWSGMTARVRQCEGRWVTLDVQDLNEIGVRNCTLGEDLTVGEEVYDCSGAFGVTLGPVDWRTYLDFLPEEASFRQTCALTRLYCIDPLSFDVEVVISPREIPEMVLSSGDDAGRLARTAWTRTDPIDETSVTFATA